MSILAPSILAADFTDLAKDIRLAELGGADWIHCDVMDGHFVPNISFGPGIVAAAKKATRLPLDVHLMIEDPDKYLEDFAKAGASRITVHFEAAVHLNRAINRIKELGLKAGIAINPSTPVSFLENIAEYIDLLLIMTVNPGFGGQKFVPNSLQKIKDAVKLRNDLKADFLIQTDGGISAENIKGIQTAGCDAFVVGSSLFHSDNITAAAAELKNLITK